MIFPHQHAGKPLLYREAYWRQDVGGEGSFLL